MMLRPLSILALGVCLIGVSDAAEIGAISKDVNDLKYFYFPTASEKVEITFNNGNSLEASNLRSGVPTLLVIDGFLSDSTSPMSTGIKDAYANRGNKNVIVIDWGRLSGSGLTLGNQLETAGAYLTALGNVGPVGLRLAQFINFISENKNVAYSDFTIIGHSLGAHIAGACGTHVQTNYGATIGRIAGLDPAGPFFSMQIDKDKRLHKGDAIFVDIYHTNRGTLGDSGHDTGDINVYVNGGSKQPGCEEADQSGFAGFCSHSYSWQIFNAAFTDSSITACPCSGDDCICTTCSYTCANPVAVGPDVPRSALGRLHLTHGPLA